MSDLMVLCAVSVIGNAVLVWICKEELKRNEKLIADCFYFMDEIIRLKDKVKQLEKK